jgi:hypothetical protein
MYDKNPQTGSAIQPVGEARIILAAIAVIELSHRDRLADVAARQFLVRRGMGSVTNPDHEGLYRQHTFFISYRNPMMPLNGSQNAASGLKRRAHWRSTLLPW